MRWSGRFSHTMDPKALSYGASISFDQKLARYDIQGSLAYCRTLRRAGVLSPREADRIRQGLTKLARQIKAGRFQFTVEAEDVHLNIERALIAAIGPVGGKLHTGRSRNDQVATDLRLYCLDHLKQLHQAVRDFERTLVTQAKRWSDVALPGYTHLQRAQPVLLGHHLLAYVEMLSRDEERLMGAIARTSVLPLGSGALSGHAFGIDRKALARELGFANVSHNSLDAVSDRDFAVEIAAAAALISIHLSRLAEELILWSSSEFNFIKLPEAYCTGSSMMPQKVNPDLPELVRAKTGRIIGDLNALLVILKGLPLAYNKDLQEDKEPLFDIFETLLPTLEVFAALIRKVELNRNALQSAVADEALLATDLADELTRNQVPFREAHEIVAKLVRTTQAKGISFCKLSTQELKKIDRRLNLKYLRVLDASHAIARRRTLGGTAASNVLKEISRQQKRLKARS